MSNDTGNKSIIKLSSFQKFTINSMTAIFSKTVAAPIERIKLLIQNQAEMLKKGTLDTPYKGMLDCTKRTLDKEGVASFLRVT